MQDSSNPYLDSTRQQTEDNMRSFFILLALGTVAAGQYQPLNVKTGQWQTTVLVNSGGSLAMPSGYMAKLTPEQRAQVESSMKRASQPKTTTRTNQDCVTQDEINQGNPFKSDDKQCTQKVLSSTSSTLNVEQDCVQDSMSTKTVMSLEAINPELVKGTGTVAITSEGHTFTSNLNFTSTWMSSSCSKKNNEGVLSPGLKSKLRVPNAATGSSPAPR
jgi:hypothetical protein